MRAKAGQRRPQRVVRHAFGESRRGGDLRLGQGASLRFKACRPVDRSLLERQPTDATPAEMRVDALDQHIRHMLQFQREAAFDADLQGRRLWRCIGVAAGRSRWPLQLDRLRVGGKPFADYVVPVENHVGLAKTLTREHGVDRRADEIGERLRPSAFTGRSFHDA